MAKQKAKKTKTRRAQTVRRCGLCGKIGKLTKTECCDQWICDDEDQYVMFSYSRDSCYRNHSHHTLCGYHFIEGHSGHWKDCEKCKQDFSPELEMYVYYGTNEYNFEKLENPPEYEPTRCSKCGGVIVMSEGGYSQRGEEYWCPKCANAQFSDVF